MSLVQQKIQALRAIKARLPEIAKEHLILRKDEIIEKLQEQLEGGLLSDGSEAPEYSPITDYIARTERRSTGYPIRDKTGSWNFQWTGELFDSMHLEVTSDAYIILSIPWKISVLEEMLGGQEFMALTPEHNTWVNNNVIFPAIYGEITRVLAMQ